MKLIYEKRAIKNICIIFVLLFCISSVGYVLLGCNKAKDTTNPLDTTAPEISNITATSISSSQATINWTTNEPATSQVLYGLTSSYGSQTQKNTSLVSSHSMTLTDLQSGSLYHYQVKSGDEAGNTRTSADNLFTTVVGAPVISNVSAKVQGYYNGHRARIEWKTDQPATSKVYYTYQQGTWIETIEDTKLTTDHRVDIFPVILGLKTYWFRIYSKNSLGSYSNKGEDYSLTFITPPL